MGSRIKALTVAGLSPVCIAGRLHTSPESIETFLKLFFDVSAYVANHAARSDPPPQARTNFD